MKNLLRINNAPLFVFGKQLPVLGWRHVALTLATTSAVVLLACATAGCSTPPPPVARPKPAPVRNYPILYRAGHMETIYQYVEVPDGNGGVEKRIVGSRRVWRDPIYLPAPTQPQK
jgi:hypothetical protein